MSKKYYLIENNASVERIDHVVYHDIYKQKIDIHDLERRIEPLVQSLNFKRSQLFDDIVDYKNVDMEIEIHLNSEENFSLDSNAKEYRDVEAYKNTISFIRFELFNDRGNTSLIDWICEQFSLGLMEI